MIKLFELMLSGFWQFAGVMLFFSLILGFIFRMWSRTLRYWTLRKHGYPPPHCDADGDIITDDQDCEEN